MAKDYEEVMLTTALCGGLAAKTGLPPLTGKTSQVQGARRYLSIFLEQIAQFVRAPS